MLPLRTTRLLLRDFTHADHPQVHAYSTDPEIVRFMHWGPRTEDETRAFLQRMIDSQRASPRLVYELAMVRAEDFALIGACDLTLDGAGEGDLGYLLTQAAWGHGYATEAARALLALGFERLGLRRIFATCDPRNVASQRVLQRLGMVKERELRRHVHAKGRFWDSYEYAVYPP